MAKSVAGPAELERQNADLLEAPHQQADVAHLVSALGGEVAVEGPRPVGDLVQQRAGDGERRDLGHEPVVDDQCLRIARAELVVGGAV